MDQLLVALQAFNLAFLLLHDWVPLGRFSNLPAIRSEDSRTRSLLVGLVPAIPVAIGLIYSAKALDRPWPHSLSMLLSITYGALFLGLLRAWWIPYLFRPEPERAARYQRIFAGTCKFLPTRNGISPDTLHVLLHASIVATLLLVLIHA